MALVKSQSLLFVPVVAALTGCGAWYEEVPAFGQTDPTYASIQQQPIQQVQAQANQATAAVDPGQPVDQTEQDQYADNDPAALTDFKQTLDPYGTWADDPTYGTVWQPDPGVVGADFQPYVTDGYWGYDTDYVWVSNYDWGWAPFHYGRWVYIPGRGWSWIPGRRYAGAWVGWRTGADGYIGWGPLAPTWGWRNGAAFNYGFATRTPYAFCATGDLFSRSLRDRVLAGPQANTIAANTHDWVRDPNVHTVGPIPSRFGIAPPPFDRRVAGVGLDRAQGFSRPSTAIPYGARTPMTWNRPVVTAPRYIGVQPTYHPYQVPYQHYSPYAGGVRPYTVPYGGGHVYSGGGHVYGGAPYGGYHSYSAPMAPSHSYSHSYSRGGGFSGGGGFHGGGGGFHGGGGHGGHR